MAAAVAAKDPTSWLVRTVRDDISTCDVKSNNIEEGPSPIGGNDHQGAVNQCMDTKLFPYICDAQYNPAKMTLIIFEDHKGCAGPSRTGKPGQWMGKAKSWKMVNN
ncbi:hypothetical protein N7492_002198 [Penicillium capsulatum]|uniref:Uncharacterized protein n=1 Tax=Penicillium capsulatum TaxID=69766 RepID=A0A9W9LUW8_9EURO|nr:hypothetical protein N7492_002198 [Penicillium capsulatum]